MMDGVYVNGERPKTKKALREAVESAPETVELEHTAMGEEGRTSLMRLPVGRYYVVGPDPYTSRKWYGHVVVLPNGKRKVG
jgi:hypothetical protein